MVTKFGKLKKTLFVKKAHSSNRRMFIAFNRTSKNSINFNQKRIFIKSVTNLPSSFYFYFI